MKKALALLLALVMVFALCACGSSGGTGAATAGGSSSGGQTGGGAAASGEPYHVKLELCSLSTVPSLEATKNVEDEINKYIKAIDGKEKKERRQIFVDMFIAEKALNAAKPAKKSFDDNLKDLLKEKRAEEKAQKQ